MTKQTANGPAANLVAGDLMIGEDVVGVPARLSRLQRRQNLSLATSASTMGVPRMNTHIFLALSFLALGATARPMNGATDESGITSGLAAHDVSNVAGGGIVDHVADSFLKYLRSGSSDQTLVVERPSTPPPNNGEDTQDELVLHDDPALPEIEAPKHTTIELPPSLSAALGFAKMLSNMREVFAHIAVKEGQDRGFIPEKHSTALLIQKDGGGLQFVDIAEPDEPIVHTSPKAILLSAHVGEEDTVEESLTDSPIDSISVEVESEDGLAIPGAFDSPRPAKNEPASSYMDHLFTIIDPYAALAMSAITASLVVVLVIMWRYYARRTIEAGMLASMRAAEEGLAGKKHPFYAPEAEKPREAEEEFNEKQELTLDGPASLNGRLIEYGTGNNTTDSEEDREAKKALRLLMDVANAAANARGAQGSDAFHNEPVPRSTNLKDAVAALRSAASTPRPSLCVPRPSMSFNRRGMSPLGESCDLSESDTESASYASAAASPSSSPPKESNLAGFSDYSFPTTFPANISDYPEADPEDLSLPVYQPPILSASGLPSAQLTQVALDLALNLPGTEWIFQFLVIFVSWFGMFMRPIPRRS